MNLTQIILTIALLLFILVGLHLLKNRIKFFAYRNFLAWASIIIISAIIVLLLGLLSSALSL